MSQDNKKSFVMYQGDGSNNVFSVPMTKGKYGTISVAFVRRGLDQYEYNPDTWGLNGGLFAWDSSGTKVYTDTATPAIGAAIYDQYGVDTGDTVTAVGGATITVNTNVYTRDTLHDVDENTVLAWTGDTLQIGDYIVIERTTTRTQPFEFQNNQKHIEKSDDNLERQIQEVADKVDNALLVDPTHVIDSNKMNPVEWMKTILRSVDKSVRGFRYLNGWLDYSLDDPNVADADKTWTHLVNTDNIKAIREQSRIENNETIYYTEYLAQDGSWKTLSDPHKWDNMKLSDLADTDFTNLSTGNFIMFDGLKWKNVNSSATASWGTVLGNIDDQADLKDALDAKVNIDGTSIMTAPLKFVAGSMRGAVGPYLNGVSFWKMSSQHTITNIANLTDSQFLPVTTNAIDLGRSANKWKDLYLGGKAYVATLNNGADLSVPIKSGTLATTADVELAARSGRMLTDQGVWFAKMYAATVVPTGAEYDGKNYADFSQVDAENNPVIKIYTGASGVWTLSETITPPAEYDGYVPVTSKIWDIAEQAGQQGGRVLWNHTSKEFTPYPTIISFEDIEITGYSEVIMPQNPGANQIVNKDYVDEAIAAIPTPTVDIKQSIDAEIVGTLTVNNSTVSGFSDTDYLTIPGVLDLNQDFEIGFSFTTPRSLGLLTRKLFALSNSTSGFSVIARDGKNLYIYINGNLSTGSLALSSDTKYWVKVTRVGDVYTLYSSTDGTTYTSVSTITTADTLLVGKYAFKLYNPSMPGVSAGTLYMEDAYILLNGICVWQGMGVPGLHQRVPTGHEVIEFQAPTAQNNYTWYRKYADGWVEQGGISATGSGTSGTITLPIAMQDNNYTAIAGNGNNAANNYFTISRSEATTTTIKWYKSSSGMYGYWEVKGMAQV